MIPTWPILRILRALGPGALAALLASGCSRPEDNVFQGYIEGEFVHVAAPVPGILLEARVERGDSVRKGDPLFLLEATAEKADLEEAEARLDEARARLENLLKGRRPTEIAAHEARVAEAAANLEFWDGELARHRQLFRDNVIAAAELDEVTTRRDAAKAALDTASAELATARLGGREDEIEAARAAVRSAEARLARARWALDEKVQHAPEDAAVHDVLHRPGEFIPAGTPAVILLPPRNLKARFFVPQARLSSLRAGDEVEVHRDGAAAPVPARIRYVATRAEFTPPVIYSRSARAKLVFMVEAAFDPGATPGLRPGQPVDVRLRSSGPDSDAAGQ